MMGRSGLRRATTSNAVLREGRCDPDGTGCRCARARPCRPGYASTRRGAAAAAAARPRPRSARPSRPVLGRSAARRSTAADQTGRSSPAVRNAACGPARPGRPAGPARTSRRPGRRRARAARAAGPNPASRSRSRLFSSRRPLVVAGAQAPVHAPAPVRRPRPGPNRSSSAGQCSAVERGDRRSQPSWRASSVPKPNRGVSAVQHRGLPAGRPQVSTSSAIVLSTSETSAGAEAVQRLSHDQGG